MRSSSFSLRHGRAGSRQWSPSVGSSPGSASALSTFGSGGFPPSSHAHAWSRQESGPSRLISHGLNTKGYSAEEKEPACGEGGRGGLPEREGSLELRSSSWLWGSFASRESACTPALSRTMPARSNSTSRSGAAATAGSEHAMDRLPLPRPQHQHPERGALSRSISALSCWSQPQLDHSVDGPLRSKSSQASFYTAAGAPSAMVYARALAQERKRHALGRIKVRAAHDKTKALCAIRAASYGLVRGPILS